MSRERVNQKLRTRRDLQDAAAALVSEGKTPTVASAAARAGISRATAYRFYPRPDELLLEALLAAGMKRVATVLDDSKSLRDPEERLKRLFTVVYDVIDAYELPWRAFLRHSLRAEEGKPTPERAGRRLDWIDQTLDPVRKSHSANSYAEIRNGLAALLGIETMIVFRDVCGLTSAQARQTAWKAGRALLRSYLQSTRQVEGKARGKLRHGGQTHS